MESKNSNLNLILKEQKIFKMVPPVVVLCGGYGTRAREINSKVPKILIDIEGKPFLFWILKNLENKGIKKVFLCTGYKSYLIEKFVKKSKYKFKIKISISKENAKKLLGTGGAIKKILPNLPNKFFVMNGDTFLFLNFKSLIEKSLKSKKLIIMKILKNNDPNHKNNVQLKRSHILYDKTRFNNKMKYIDYGILYLKKKVFKNYPKKFEISELLKEYSFKKEVGYIISKEIFFEIGGIYGYKQTCQNFQKIKNEIYKKIY